MKSRLNFMSSLVLALGCAVAQAEEQPWAFVTAVGGLEPGTPVKLGGRWSLPIRADVSGLQSIKNKPTTMNSALVCTAVKAQVRGNDIFLLVETSVTHGTATSSCPNADLGHLAGGSYNVWYGKAQAKGIPLGAVRIAL
jgi:hypothetical protein